MRSALLTRLLTVLVLVVGFPMIIAPQALALNNVVVTIPVVGTTWTLAMNPNGLSAYVADTGGTAVSVIDTSSNTVTQVITVGSQPTPMAVTPNGSTLYVGNWGDGTISVINTATNTITATITPPPAFPDIRDIEVTPDGSKFVVSDLTNNVLFIYSTSTNTLLATVNTALGPQYVEILPDGSKAYVSDRFGSAITVVNLTSYIPTDIPLPTAPVDITLSPDGSRLFVGHAVAPEISVIDTSTGSVSTSITTGSRADHLTATSSHVYAATYSAVGGSIVTPVTIGSWTVLSSIPVANKARQVLISPDGLTGYSLGETTATVTAFSTSTNQVVASILVGSVPAMAAFTPDGTRLYVASASGSVAVVDTDNPASRDTSQDPTASLQQFAISPLTQVTECGVLAPDAVDWPALSGKRAQGWRISYADWPNQGSGGWVCSRQPMWKGSHWGFASS